MMEIEDIPPIAAIVIDLGVLSAALYGYISFSLAAGVIAGTKAGLNAGEGRKWYRRLKSKE